ncbi:membrane protein insertase YidC [Cyclobacterium marinum]|uniref:Membrane protein insertase YidC n=1 Tax=Cyclobacterium marinum (strain ATCC 25205 / DSM 745 / LMG 13164 / NCIMB 1802) TaxID=880070 RepID=G0IYV9_CYCMS|nr:membrane protein insertase YidC [Cyclobacterium marinum]AEL28104.1 Membrane protein oxaA [Cyclobacterium marinum DSM 745]
MDKNQATGLILFAAVILVYSLFFASDPQPVIEPQKSNGSTQVQSSAGETEQGIEANDNVNVDSLQNVAAMQKYGDFSNLVNGQESEKVLENDDVKITLSNKGGEIQQVEIKGFKTYDQKPLIIFDSETGTIDYRIKAAKGELSLNDLFFEVNESSEVIDEVKVSTVTFTANAGSGTIVRKYHLPATGYQLSHKIEGQGLNNLINDDVLTINWQSELKRLEEDMGESRRKTYMNFYTSDETYDYLSTGEGDDSEQVGEPIKWVAFKQRFFTSGIIAKEQFNNGNLAQETPIDSSYVKNMSATLQLPINGEVSYYFGPNNYKVLKNVTPEFDKNVDMGYIFVSWVNKYIIVNLFHWLENFFNNYGVIIILIVFIIKLFLLPLTYKSYIGMAKMRVIKPEIDELKEKYGEDQTKMQQEQMKLFSQLGVSPISGCLPMVLQMPFLLAMFFFFPNSIELRQESFLWAHDLSTYDSIVNLPFTIPFYGSHVSLFTLLMTVSQIAYTHFNNQLTTAQGPMKNIGYVMPVVFMFVLNSFPAALSFYYFVSNMVTFGQQYLIKQFVDDDKIRAKVEESKLKNANKKKSKFQMKIEQAMKAAENNKTETKKRKGKK